MRIKEKCKSRNRGFSLMELIVVILVMGILTVVFTPIVIHWVDRAKVAVDRDYLDAVKDAVDHTYLNEEIFSSALDKEVKITITHYADSTKIEADSSIKTKDGRSFEQVFEGHAGSSIDSFVFKKVHDAVLVYKNGILLPEEVSDTVIPIEFSNDLSE